MKPKLLFVDDKPSRCEDAIKRYGDEYEVILAHTVADALRQMSGNNLSVVSLDHDLNGQDFQDPDESTSGMAILRYLQKTGWPFDQRPRPRFLIHSTNLFAASAMVDILWQGGFDAISQPYNWKQYQHGVVAGAFDVIHPGYIYLLREAKELCHKVTVLLHDKPNQVFELSDRATALLALKYVDDVIPYTSEEGLDKLLETLHPDVRIVGNDHKGSTTRPNINVKTIYHDRQHLWSATRYKKMIAEKVGVVPRYGIHYAPCKHCGVLVDVNDDGVCFDCFNKGKE